MRNLLPKDYRRRVKMEYLVRVSVVALGLIFVVTLVGAALLVPSYFLSRSKKSSVQGQTEHIGRSIAQSEGAVSFEMLRKVRERLELLSRDRDRATITTLLRDVVEEEPTGVGLSDIAYVREGEGGTITISGNAERRDDLIAFKEALERNSRFSGVTLPVSDLARSSDIRFSITFKTKL